MSLPLARALLIACLVLACDASDSDPSDDGGVADTGGGGDSSTQLDAPGGAGQCGAATGQLLPAAAPWNTPIDTAPVDAESDQIIDFLQETHTAEARFQIDFSLTVLGADDSTPRLTFNPTGDHFSPDCDTTPVPVPTGGALEGESGYACESDGDCHLLVIDSSACRLYEMWRADIRGGDFNGGCLAVWDLNRVYPETGRGDYCTSADAAGLPIAPLLFSADEVVNGSIRHAIRFILPNEYIRDLVYVRPATHSTGATGGGPDTPPYGARLRLRADADISGLSPPARVVAIALQRYGMFLADGGNLTFTAQSDLTTALTWEEAGLGPHDLKALQWSDFEVVELGERLVWDGDCEREVVTQ